VTWMRRSEIQHALRLDPGAGRHAQPWVPLQLRGRPEEAIAASTTRRNSPDQGESRKRLGRRRFGGYTASDWTRLHGIPSRIGFSGYLFGWRPATSCSW